MHGLNSSHSESHSGGSVKLPRKMDFKEIFKKSWLRLLLPLGSPARAPEREADEYLSTAPVAPLPREEPPEVAPVATLLLGFPRSSQDFI